MGGVRKTRGVGREVAFKEVLKTYYYYYFCYYCWFLLLGTLLINMGRYKEAIAFLTTNIASYPNAFEFYVARGSAHAMEGSLVTARTDLDKAIELNPTYADSYIRRGQIRSALGDVKVSVLTLNMFFTYIESLHYYNYSQLLLYRSLILRTICLIPNGQTIRGISL